MLGENRHATDMPIPRASVTRSLALKPLLLEMVKRAVHPRVDQQEGK